MYRAFLWVAVFMAMAFPADSQQAGSDPSNAQALSNLTWYAPPRSVGHDSLGGVQILTKLSAEQSRIMDDKHVTLKMMAAIYRKWLPLIPEKAGSPTFKKGNVAIELTLYPDGSVHNMRLAGGSGDVALDRAAWEAITGASKYAPFPAELNLPELRLRFCFTYNEDEVPATQPPAH